MVYRGHVKNGKIELDEATPLPNGASVEVTVTSSPVEAEPLDNGATLYERLKPIIGIAQGLSPDASVNVDHYLYDHAKR